MRDVYESGYGMLFPDSNVLSIVIPAIRSYQETRKTDERKFRILDIGCGIGSNLLIVNEFADVKYDGLDVSKHAGEIARRRIKAMNLNQRAQIHVLSTEQFLISENETWDLILDRASLQHHEVLQGDTSREKFLANLSSKLAPEGKLVSLWAGEKNHNSDLRFSSFVPFEEIRSAFEGVLDIVSLKQISRFDLHSNQHQLVAEEFLVVAKSRSS
jgi:cyclopropane fatty-acyl-phospholipid synthase-like methyltransferase